MDSTATTVSAATIVSTAPGVGTVRVGVLSEGVVSISLLTSFCDIFEFAIKIPPFTIVSTRTESNLPIGKRNGKKSESASRTGHEHHHAVPGVDAVVAEH